jgi:hypothetical protein
MSHNMKIQVFLGRYAMLTDNIVVTGVQKGSPLTDCSRRLRHYNPSKGCNDVAVNTV